MAETPLVTAGPLDGPIARVDGRAVSRRQYVADAIALAERLPSVATLLNLSTDRYRFAVGLGAALLRGHASLLPPNHLPDTIARLRERHAHLHALVDARSTGDDPAHGLPTTLHATVPAPASAVREAPRIDDALVAAYVLTSGSTGEPQPHAKAWGLLAVNARGEARRLAALLGRPDLEGMGVVATVPAQHMYGFESSVLVALHGGAVLDAGRPFFPADIAARIAATPSPRMLVTTPFHLKALLDANLELPPLDLVVCATAPLAPQLAARAEAACRAPLVEIYGCTEAGQVATRRTTEGPEWRTFDGIVLAGDGASTSVSGGHVAAPTMLADVIEVTGRETFRLLGRSNDLVNVAGKRSSLGHLDFHLNSIEGVVDGAFCLMPDPSGSGPGRLAALVVAPRVGSRAIVDALRSRIDAAFLPRRVFRVEALPREASAKLTAARLEALVAAMLARSADRKPEP